MRCRHASVIRPRRRSLLGIVASASAAAGLLVPAVPAGAASAWSVNASTRTGQGQAQVLSPPASVTGTCTNANTARTVTVTWASVPHATYTIYQSTTSATSGFTVAASAVTGTTWTSGTLSSGSTYWYEVAAVLSTTWQSAPSTATTGRKISTTRPLCQ